MVVGAGAAGLEAARVAAERGHSVTVLEAAVAGRRPDPARRAEPAPQGADRHRRLAAGRTASGSASTCATMSGRSRTMCWRCRPTWSIVATGGLPQNPPLEAGDDLVTSSWDIIAGAVKPAENVLLYDDNGGHPGMTAAETDRQCGREAGAGFAGALLRAGDGRHEPRALYARLPREGRTRHHQHAAEVGAPRRQPAGRDARLGLFAEGWSEERRVDQVVVEHGTLPLDDLYFALKPLSKNGGAVDYERLVAAATSFPARNPGKAVSCCSASAMRLPPATSTPRSMTASGSGCGSEGGYRHVQKAPAS